jgi:hypothetical protein
VAGVAGGVAVGLIVGRRAPELASPTTRLLAFSF